ncbi:MAG: DUF1553 domain-containing protein, partial [Planctomycetaceae bacterium]
PLLREQCFRCHGDKAQGGLRLTRRESALLSGDSGIAAVVPGKPAESALVARIHDDMPPTDEGLSSAQIEILEQWVTDGAPWPAVSLTEEETSKPKRIDHVSWIRRVYFDTVGVPPTFDEFTVAQKQSRESLVDELLHDVRYADHWVSFWLDVLAENPTLLNTSLGSTGPFRWFLYDSLRDNKPVDRMVTELIMMRGDVGYGGSSGFQVAGENDAPLAAKAHILSAAFLGIETQCARCHDSPYHSTTQEDLYNIAAMLARKPITPPASSRVPDEFFEEHSREPLIRVSLPLGEAVKPQWPFEATTSLAHDDVSEILQNPRDSRERLAALITSPRNSRFAKVLVNHLWKRLIGAGLVEPVHDWEGKQASHPKLLDALANDLIGHDYDLKYVLRRILLSDIYSRSATGRNKQATPEQRFFVAPDRRRLSAEQVVDALFTASGREMDVEELTFVHDNSHTMVKRLTLGVPKRAWMFAGLNNERDRPSLSMPRAQSVVDVLEAFGWTGTRQKPVFERETNPNILQPGILANGDLTMSLSRAAVRSDLAELAIQAESPEQLVSQLFIRFLSREPNAAERDRFSAALSRGFSNRSVESSMVSWPAPDSPLPQSTWTNHLQPEANEVQLEWLRRVRRGPHPDPRLNAKWREVYEDVVWSLINHGEFVWLP